MPIYTFQNKDNGNVFELSMSIEEREEFLKTYPEYKQVILHAPALGDSVRLNVRRTDNEFNSLLKQIKKNNPGSNIETR